MSLRKEKAKITFEIDLNESEQNYELLGQILKVAENFEINGLNPLDDALRNLDEKMIEKLYESKKIDKQIWNEYLERSLAVEKIFNIFIKAGAGIDNDLYGSECLRKAVNNWDSPKKVQMVIDSGVKVRKDELIKCLNRAVEKGNIQIVEILIAFGADIKDVNRDAIITVVVTKKVDMLKFLIKEGVELKKYENVDLWSLAAQDKDPIFGQPTDNSEILQLLFDEKLYEKSKYKLVDIIKYGDEDNNYYRKFLEELIKQKVDVNEGDGLPLYHASNRRDRTEILELLLKAGAEVTKYKYAKLAIINAIECNNIKMVKLLIEAGADVTVEDSVAVAKSADVRNEAIMDLLIEAGANIRGCGDRALMYAIVNNDFKLVKKLIRLGANPLNPQAMRWAEFLKNEKMIRFLMKLGAKRDVHGIPADVTVTSISNKGRLTWNRISDGALIDR